jgi:sucrose-phosphate synthase
VYAPRGKPLGLAPLEAAAAGRPVVATRGGGCEEILNGEAACLVPADAMALAGAIDRVLSDPERVTRMGRAARQLVEPLTWDRTAEQLLTLFCRAARRARQVSI